MEKRKLNFEIKTLVYKENNFNKLTFRSVVLNRGAAEPLGAAESSRGSTNS